MSLFKELEPEALTDYEVNAGEPPNALLQASVAISLRRIADALAAVLHQPQDTGDDTP